MNENSDIYKFTDFSGKVSKVTITPRSAWNKQRENTTRTYGKSNMFKKVKQTFKQAFKAKKLPPKEEWMVIQ